MRSFKAMGILDLAIAIYFTMGLLPAIGEKLRYLSEFILMGAIFKEFLRTLKALTFVCRLGQLHSKNIKANHTNSAKTQFKYLLLLGFETIAKVFNSIIQCSS